MAPYFDAFFVSAPAGLVILDSNLRVVRANATIAEMVGVSPAEIVGRNPRTLVPQLAPTVEHLLKTVLSTHAPTLNFPISGETPKQPRVIRNWIASVFAVNTPDSRRTDVGAIVVEVNDSIRLEQVERSESLLAEAEELASVGSWESNLLTGEGRRSENLCRLLGLKPSGGAVVRLVLPLAGPDAEQPTEASIATGDSPGDLPAGPEKYADGGFMAPKEPDNSKIS